MNKHILLNYIKVLQERICSKSGLVQVILGPRQAGKTTTTLKLLKAQFKNTSTYVSADSVFNAESGWLRQSWQQALQDNKILVIDEIQKRFNFVIKKGCSLWAIEVKSGRKKSTSGLAVFKNKFPDSNLVIITPENHEKFESDPSHFLKI